MTTTSPFDQPTRELVSRDGLHRTLFVEAGAGTGKTTQLVERITNLVLVEGVRLANIAAITFTEAAAAELQARIRVRFEQRAEQTTDAVERERCRLAIADADLAAISTLHGFASRLLGELSMAAGLPPRIRVLDEVSSELAHEDRWARFVDALYDDPVHEPVLVRAAVLGVALEPRYPNQATLKDVAVELNDNWDRLSTVAAEQPKPLTPIDFSPFDAAVAAVAALPERCTDPDDAFYRHLTEVLIPEMSPIAGLDDPDRKLRALVDVAPKGWGLGRGGRGGCWDGDVQTPKALVTAVNEAARDVVGRAADEVLRHLLVLIAREVLDAATARREDGGLEFHDLLVLARDLLRRSSDARRRLHDRYTHILLDEFQDTDPIQIDLAVLIAGSITAPADGATLPAWHDLPVDEGRLFFVGDPKQSIYRFRRADIELFLQARDRFGPGGTWARLTTNFRTVSPIIEWVNAFFADAMAEERQGMQPRYEPLTRWREPADGAGDRPPADHRPVLLGGPHPDPKVKAGPLRAAEAADVARAVVSVRDEPERWPVFDTDEGAWRDARLADVTVLVPTRTSLPYLRKELEAAGIPYRLATGTLVYDTQEVRDAMAAVRAVDDPTDELSLVAALRSPLYACSDVDLFTFRDAGGRWDIRLDPPDGVGDQHPVRLAMAHLRSLWRVRWWLGPSAMVERLLRERRAFVLGFGDPRPDDVWRRLRFLIDQARAFEEAQGGDLRAFVDWTELQSAESARVHEPLLPEHDDEAVRILTIHAAKGLEFPITILSGLTTRPGRTRTGVSLLWSDAGEPEVRLRKGLATANHEPRADLELEMDEHEKRRLLYVAATRARDHLVVSCHHKVSAADTYAGWLSTFFAEKEGLWRRLPEAAEEPDDAGARRAATTAGASRAGEAAPAPSDTDDREEWLARREQLLAPQRVPAVVSATGVARAAADLEARAAVATEPDVDGDDAADHDDARIVPVRRKGRAGSAVGRAVHATLQVLDLADPQEIDAQVRRQCDVESIPDLVPVVAALVRSALASDTVRLAGRSPHHREIHVAAPVGDRVIEGYIDLLVETDGGLVVVDYKTDSATSEAEIDAKLAAYELQGASYAVALEEATGLKVTDCRFVFCRSSGAVERSVTDLRGAMDRVRAAVTADGD